MTTRKTSTLAAFDSIVDEIGQGLPGAERFRRLSSLIIDVPGAHRLARLNPSSPTYKDAAMALYLQLRGRQEDGYDAERDEMTNAAVPENIWTGSPPWSFRDCNMLSEHLLSWGHIFSQLNLPPQGRLLEYGPGSGQVLLMAARLGHRAFGVDIDPTALANIARQASLLGVSVETETSKFGAGFDGQVFDTILFYEAFHHAFEFEDLLEKLHTRLKPGGRVVLCGEPIVGGPSGAVPYPWGPRLDALSVFCIRRFGWMELGFTRDYFMSMVRSKGWTPRFLPFANTFRAAIYVLEPTGAATTVDDRSEHVQEVKQTVAGLQHELTCIREELAAVQASTSWRVTGPLRRLRTFLNRFRGTA